MTKKLQPWTIRSGGCAALAHCRNLCYSGDMSRSLVAALYKFVGLPDCAALAAALQQRCEALHIKGTLLLAREGINGTVAGSEQELQALLRNLEEDGRFADMDVKLSWVEVPPFQRLKIKVKDEIVTLGQPDVDPTTCVGTYVDGAAWNQLLQDPDVLVLDTRNEYEVQMGTFTGAVNPHTTKFREFPDFVKRNLDPQKHRKVAMFCTGGIRCEKASSFMLSQGFSEVFHLRGGILKYLETVPSEQSLWQGDCFVFDQRVALNQALEPGEHTICGQCQHPLSAADRASSAYEQDVSCAYCAETLTERQRKALRARARALPAVPPPLRAR